MRALVTILGRRVVGLARKIGIALGMRSDRDLVISYLFPPAAEAAGIVVAKRLRAWPRDVDVIANQPPPRREPDPGAILVAGDRVKRVARAKGAKNALKNWSIVERFCARGWPEIEKFEQRRGPYRRVYSRAMMPASHVLAAVYKIRRPDAWWTAEFSDPLLLDTHGDRREAEAPDSPLTRELGAALAERGIELDRPDEMFTLVETVTFALADEIMFTNANQRALMLSTITSPQLREEVRRKSVLAPHPSPSSDLYELHRSPVTLAADRVNIGYFGVFYGVRSLDDLLLPLTGLDIAERRKVMLNVFTNKVDAAEAAVAEAGLADCVAVRGFVPYLEFLNLARRMDWLIVADSRVSVAHGLNPYLPSKLSDYLGSGTPVWALVEDGSPMSEISGITRTRLDDHEQASQLLRRIIAAR